MGPALLPISPISCEESQLHGPCPAIPPFERGVIILDDMSLENSHLELSSIHALHDTVNFFYMGFSEGPHFFCNRDTGHQIIKAQLPTAIWNHLSSLTFSHAAYRKGQQPQMHGLWREMEGMKREAASCWPVGACRETANSGSAMIPEDGDKPGLGGGWGLVSNCSTIQRIQFLEKG